MIYLEDAQKPNKSCIYDKHSTKVNGRRPFAQDRDLFNYSESSEDECLEENDAEDIGEADEYSDLDESDS